MKYFIYTERYGEFIRNVGVGVSKLTSNLKKALVFHSIEKAKSKLFYLNKDILANLSGPYKIVDENEALILTVLQS